MRANRLFYFIACLILFTSCSKDDDKGPAYTINYRLKGWYLRDAAIKTDGLIGINFSENGNYCWRRQFGVKDSFRCEGTFTQTSDTSFLWNGFSLVNFRIDSIDSQNRKLKIRITTAPPSGPLTGSY